MEHFPGWPQLIGQACLAVLLIIQTLVQSWSSRQRRKEEREDRNREREELKEEQKNLAQDLLQAQRDRAEALAQLTEERASHLDRKLEVIKDELQVNTQVNVAALESANNFNQKLEEHVLMCDPKTSPGHIQSKYGTVDPASEQQETRG